MCDRTQIDVYCDTATRFTDVRVEPPVVSDPAQKLRGGSYGTLRMSLVEDLRR